jgi:hypothetical protein
MNNNYLIDFQDFIKHNGKKKLSRQILFFLLPSIMWTIIRYEYLSLLGKETDDWSEILWALFVVFISVSILYASSFFFLRHVLRYKVMKHTYRMNDVTEYLMFVLIGSVRIENCSRRFSFRLNIICIWFKILIRAFVSNEKVTSRKEHTRNSCA